jgi:hypothetical protein
MFKFNKVFLAVAATLFAGQAFAAPVTQAQINTARGNGALNEAWISGASAPTYNVFQGFVAGCDADSVSVYNNGTSTNVSRPGASASGNFLAYACTRGGVVSVLYHTIDGGSFNAYAPHIPNDVDGDGNFGTTNLRRISRLGNNSACAAQTGTFALPGQSAIPVFRSCSIVTPATAADGAPVLPAGGFSDVEAALWGVSTDGYGTEINANVGQAFGIATSTSLYRAMQVAQGIYASVAAANAADPDFLPANAPTVSRAQYASIITGTVSDASVLVPGSTAPLTLARRVATSGTQATSNALFLRNPCNGEAVIGGALAPIGVADSSATLTVIEGSGTGNVKTALSGNNFAIGWLSMENDWRLDTSSNGYRFVKIDNVHPEAPVAGSGQVRDTFARYTAAQGTYDQHVELKAFVANTAAGTFGETVINDVIGAFAGLDCADVPRGLTLNPFSGSSCTPGVVQARVTRNGNNCQMQQLF